MYLCLLFFMWDERWNIWGRGCSVQSWLLRLHSSIFFCCFNKEKVRFFLFLRKQVTKQPTFAFPPRLLPLPLFLRSEHRVGQINRQLNTFLLLTKQHFFYLDRPASLDPRLCKELHLPTFQRTLKDAYRH